MNCLFIVFVVNFFFLLSHKAARKIESLVGKEKTIQNTQKKTVAFYRILFFLSLSLSNGINSFSTLNSPNFLVNFLYQRRERERERKAIKILVSFDDRPVFMLSLFQYLVIVFMSSFNTNRSLSYV